MSALLSVSVMHPRYQSVVDQGRGGSHLVAGGACAIVTGRRRAAGSRHRGLRSAGARIVCGRGRRALNAMLADTVADTPLDFRGRTRERQRLYRRK